MAAQKYPGRNVREFYASPWHFQTSKGPILKSECENLPEKKCIEEESQCTVCKYSKHLNLPSLPEMVFGDNSLTISHESGCSIEFNSLDALRQVGHEVPKDIRVASADDWQSSRSQVKELSDTAPKFDWTFTPGNYMGTIKGNVKVESTKERIDLEKLKRREKIHFYEELVLFEDELADNGTAELNVKIRIMSSGFLVLMRFFLRVDGVIVRINDTRLYYTAETEYILREYCSKEEKVQNIAVSTSQLTDPNILWELLPTKQLKLEKLCFLKS